MVELPKKLEIHKSFLTTLSMEEFSSAFRTIHNIFSDLHTTLEKKREEYEKIHVSKRYFFHLLIYLFANGETSNGVFTTDVPTFRNVNRGTIKKVKYWKTVSYCENYFKVLSDYGFVFKGLNDNHKIPNNAKTFTVEYPNMPAVIDVLHLVARKCFKNIYEDRYCIGLFSVWSYRLVFKALDDIAYDGHEFFADTLKDKTEKEFVFLFHEAMKENGFVCKPEHGIRYFENEKQLVYLFEVGYNYGNIIQNSAAIDLKLRIRDIEPCLEYLEQCPESVKDMFRQDFRQLSPECENKQFCDKSLNYVYEGEKRWHCACYGGSFQGVPLIAENIPHYVTLVKLGKTKARKK